SSADSARVGQLFGVVIGSVGVKEVLPDQGWILMGDNRRNQSASRCTPRWSETHVETIGSRRRNRLSNSTIPCNPAFVKGILNLSGANRPPAPYFQGCGLVGLTQGITETAAGIC